MRTLPEQRQEAAVEALAEIADDMYSLDEDDIDILRPALDRVARGDSDNELPRNLGEPWR